MFNDQQRPAGVKIPEGQLAEKSDLPSLTLIHLMPLEFMAAQYVDKSGKKVVGLFVLNKATKEWYQAPSGEQWLAQFRPLSEKMLQSVKNKYGADPADAGDVPMTDNVDVIAAEVQG